MSIAAKDVPDTAQLSEPPPEITSISVPSDEDGIILRLSNDIVVRRYRQGDAESLTHYANNPKIARNMTDRFHNPYTVEYAQQWIDHVTDRDGPKWISTDRPKPYDPAEAMNNNKKASGGTSNGEKDEEQAKQQQNGNPPSNVIPGVYCIAHNTPSGESKLIGTIGLLFGAAVTCNHLTAEMGYWIGEEYWGRGIATEVARAFVEWAFRTFPWLVRIKAETYHHNQGSMNVLRKLGFAHEGVMKAAVCKNGQMVDIWIFAKVREGIVSGE